MKNDRPIRLKVASPCNADWEKMSGDEAVRFCGACEKNVYELSKMTTAQVEALLNTRDGGSTCVRFYQRKDGTVMTADCPLGARIVRRKRTLVGLGAGLLSAAGFALMPQSSPPLMGAAPLPATWDEILVEPVAEHAIMGEIAVEPATDPDTVLVEPVAERMTMGDIAIEVREAKTMGLMAPPTEDDEQD